MNHNGNVYLINTACGTVRFAYADAPRVVLNLEVLAFETLLTKVDLLRRSL